MLNSFLSLIYPRVCISCSESLAKGEHHLCSHCLADLPTNLQLHDEKELRREVYSSEIFKHLFYYLKYFKTGITQKILHEIKYSGNTSLATEIGKWYGQALVNSGFKNEFDLIIPVPLHKKKLKKRGYNQAYHLSVGLSETLSAPVNTDLLIRKVNNPTQTRKSRLDRIENVENIFAIQQLPVSIDWKILLVDDVLTTGSTITSCAQVLSDGGIRNISLAVLAYAIK